MTFVLSSSLRIHYSSETRTAIRQKQSAPMPPLETTKSGPHPRGETSTRAAFCFCLEAVVSHSALQKTQQ